jgi:hypothetical protein
VDRVVAVAQTVPLGALRLDPAGDVGGARPDSDRPRMLKTRDSKSRGNDLSTPVPELGFPGLKPGDRWCLCASQASHRLKGANIKGFAEHVSASAPTASTGIVVSQHCGVRALVASLRLNHREIAHSILRSGTRAIFVE